MSMNDINFCVLFCMGFSARLVFMSQHGFNAAIVAEGELPLDLTAHLIQHPAATFFVRVKGEAMASEGIFPGDLLIVDRALEAVHGKMIVAVIQGEFTVRRLFKVGQEVWLEGKGGRVKVEPSWDFQVWGVVTYAIHDCSRRLQ